MWTELLIAANRRQRRLTRRATALVERVSEQLWLGVLREDHLQTITDRFYRNDHHLRQKEYNLGGLNFLEARLVRDHLRPDGRVLLLGAGAGREAFGLARDGFRVDAVDCNPALLDAAREWRGDLGEAAANVGFHHRPVGDLSGLDSDYDAVVIGLGAYTHIVGSAARVALLRDLRRRVRDDATLIVSYYGTGGGGRGWLLAATRTLARATRNPRVPEPHERLGDTYDRWFAPGEVASELARASWCPVELAERGLHYAVATAE